MAEQDRGAAQRLPFLDGVRALAALYVVLFHVLAIDGLTPVLAMLTGWTRYGNYAVDVFIVLSGYCLMRPILLARGKLDGGVAGFLYRRARRILPAYYAALVLSLLFIAGSQSLKAAGGASDWSVFSSGNLLSHLLLLHNLSPGWVQTIDPPLWSLSTEAQIYFVFALALLPIYRRLGILGTVALGFVAGLAPIYLLPAGANFGWACPWYLGLFTLGMAAAQVGETARQARLWAVAAAASFVLLAAGPKLLAAWPAHGSWPMETLAGCATACLLVACRAGAGRRLLEWQPLVRLGGWSYSLYLIHMPAWWLIKPAFRALHLAPPVELLARLLIGIPAVLGLAYLFHLAFERRRAPKPISATRAARQTAGILLPTARL